LLVVLAELVVVPAEHCQRCNQWRTNIVEQLTGETKPKRRQR
jgi:hypothetical protein